MINIATAIRRHKAGSCKRAVNHTCCRPVYYEAVNRECIDQLALDVDKPMLVVYSGYSGQRVHCFCWITHVIEGA